MKKTLSRLPRVVRLAALSAVVLALCSKSSPLYAFNDWMDANIFFTMGRSMLGGRVLYRDVFDHKGPVLYLLYGLAGLVGGTDFRGVLVLEIIAMTSFLYTSLRTAELLAGRRLSVWWWALPAGRAGGQPRVLPRRQRRGAAAAVSGSGAVQPGQGAAQSRRQAAVHGLCAGPSGRVCALAQVHGAGLLPRVGRGAGGALPAAWLACAAGPQRGGVPRRHGAGHAAVGRLLRRTRCAGGLVHRLLL